MRVGRGTGEGRLGGVAATTTPAGGGKKVYIRKQMLVQGVTSYPDFISQQWRKAGYFSPRLREVLVGGLGTRLTSGKGRVTF